MKKSLLALAVLASAAGAAHAASSVTMYGQVDVAYEYSKTGSLAMSGSEGRNGGQNRFGIMGQEDLGNGMAATFQLEGAFEGDTGAMASSSSFFGRESTIGLKGSFGHVRFGRSISAMETALSDYNVGNRVATTWNPYVLSTRHSNAAFYDYQTGGFTVGGDVTTRNGGAGNDLEGMSGATLAGMGYSQTPGMSYGLHAGYNGGNWTINAAYQRDGLSSGEVNYVDNFGFSDSTTAAGHGTEYGIGASYTFRPVTIGASYAYGKINGSLYDSSNTYLALGNAKAKTLNVFIAADLTANDNLYAKYMRKNVTATSTDAALGYNFSDKAYMLGMGYSHHLSKRTMLYTDIANYHNMYGDNKKEWQYDVGMQHKF